MVMAIAQAEARSRTSPLALALAVLQSSMLHSAPRSDAEYCWAHYGQHQVLAKQCCYYRACLCGSSGFCTEC